MRFWKRKHWFPAELLVISTACPVACSDDELSADACPPAGCLNGSCDAVVLCSKDGACPLGMSCVDSRCAVDPFPRVDRNDLIRGFEVPEFELRRSSERQSTFEWTAPQSAARVVCGLFVSPPEFDRAAAEKGRSLIRITNQGRSLERLRRFNADASGPERRFSFEIGDLEHEESCRGSLGVTGSKGYAVVELLRLGCWALDNAQVIGATRLIELEASELPDWDTTPKRSCQTQVDGTWCSLPGTFGACVDGRCDGRTTVPDPTPPVAEGGAGGAAPSQPGAVRDCTTVTSSGSVRCEVPSGKVGQCLHSQCVGVTSEDYRPPLVVSNCSAEGAQGLNCFPSPVFGFGTCGGGICRARCWNRADCSEALVNAGLPTGTHTCDRSSNSYVGLCVP